MKATSEANKWVHLKIGAMCDLSPSGIGVETVRGRQVCVLWKENMMDLANKWVCLKIGILCDFSPSGIDVKTVRRR